MRTCQTTDCYNVTEGSTGFCASCNHRHRKAAKERQKAGLKRQAQMQKLKLASQVPQPKPKKVSAKRKLLNEEYHKLVVRFKRDNPKCKANVNEYCTKNTEDPHHTRGRGKFLLDVSTWLPVCRSCHIFIESNPAIAKEKGLSYSRLAKTEPKI